MRDRDTWHEHTSSKPTEDQWFRIFHHPCKGDFTMTRTQIKTPSLRNLTTAIALSLACVAASIPVLTYAQNAPDTAANQEHHTQKRMGEHHKATPEQRAERVTQHLAKMKSLLQITPQQESSWQTFTSTMQSLYTNHKQERMDKAAIQNMTTPQKLDAMRAHRIQRMEKADQRDIAIKNLYAALSPEQQKTMDTHMQKMKKRMGHHRHQSAS
jgi:periplasmic protein CpxP/Spy